MHFFSDKWVRYPFCQSLGCVCIILILIAIVILYLAQLLMYSDINWFPKHTPGDVDAAVFSIYKSPFVLLISVSIVLFLKTVDLPQNLVVTFLGNNTLGIYVTHSLFMRLARHFLLFDSLFCTRLVIFLSGLLCSSILCFLMSKSKYTRFFISL